MTGKRSVGGVHRVQVRKGAGGQDCEDGPVGRAGYQDRFGRVLVCWPGPMVCRSGSRRVAKTPKIAMLEGPVRMIASGG